MRPDKGDTRLCAARRVAETRRHREYTDSPSIKCRRKLPGRIFRGSETPRLIMIPIENHGAERVHKMPRKAQKLTRVELPIHVTPLNDLISSTSQSCPSRKEVRVNIHQLHIGNKNFFPAAFLEDTNILNVSMNIESNDPTRSKRSFISEIPYRLP